ncbi:UPF0481 protein [Salvia divinorum]|uniref:UPF0481 protein n=1 Tax=Salvia divinorum TaxID=28513 RepID=A0ABD1IHE0_SALDI
MAIIEEETPDVVIVDIVESQRRILHKVPVQLRRGKTHIYEPVVVSLGPYHHFRDPQLKLVEPFKKELRDLVCGDADRKSTLLRNIYERMDVIRHFYGGVDGYTDGKLAKMMLRDTCFLICYMHGYSKGSSETYIQMRERMGMSAMLFVSCDTCMLENQIPLWIISLIYPQHQSLLCDYLSYHVYGNYSMTQLPWTEEERPLHLLEALHRTFLRPVETQQNSSFLWRPIEKYNQPRASRKKITSVWTLMDSPFRSVTDLKAKGIHLRGSSYCLADINFFSFFGLFAQLRLPIFCFSEESKVFFSNIIAFEMSPETDTDYGVTSYFNFMKTLINNAKDVKVLREKGILYSMLASDEEVLDIFKSIDTYGCGFSVTEGFYEVKMMIDEHCNSKAKTWMADLINTNFRSPWAVIALAAAMFLLCLTFLQTYYTINPRN